MKILVSLMSGSNNIERQVLRSFYKGLATYYYQQYSVKTEQELKNIAGIELVLSYEQEIIACDIGIQFGTAKDRVSDHHQTKMNLQKQAKRVIYIETPLLGRVIDNKNNYSYYRIGIDGYLNDQGTFYLDNQLDPDRIDQLYKSNLVKKFPGWKDHTQGTILVLCQLPGDSSLRGQKMSEWLIDTIQTIRSHSDRPIVIRLHPAMSPKGRGEFVAEINDLLFKNYSNLIWSNGSKPLNDELAAAGICVTYTSGGAIDAVLDGVPVVAMDRGNFAWPISSHSINELDCPLCVSDEEVDTWAMKLANCQWNCEEMHSGKVWSHLQQIIQRDKQ